MTSFNLINPVLPEYCISKGLTVTLAGFVSGCFSITALVFRPISGAAADRLNPKRLYVIAGPKRRGVASSTYYLGPDIMQGIGPIVGGFIIDHAGYSSAYYTCSALLVLGIGIYALYTRQLKHKTKQ